MPKWLKKWMSTVSSWPRADVKLTALVLNLKDAVRKLNAGGVLILPTDTLPGFHCRFDDLDAVKRIARIKGRSTGKPLLVLASGMDQVRMVVGKLDVRQSKLCGLCWPGPFTLILPANDSLPDEVTAGTGTIGVRVPALAPLASLLDEVGCPLVSTSVNQQGLEAAPDLEAALLVHGLDADGYWPLPPGYKQNSTEPMSSTLADLTCWPPQVLRQGPKSLPELSL